MILNLGYTVESAGVVETADARALLQSIKLESKMVNDAYKKMIETIPLLGFPGRCSKWVPICKYHIKCPYRTRVQWSFKSMELGKLTQKFVPNSFNQYFLFTTYICIYRRYSMSHSTGFIRKGGWIRYLLLYKLPQI